MKYFVIHSGKDMATVQDLTQNWSNEYEYAQFVMLDGTQEDWQGDATARIRECNKVLYIVGDTSAQSKNIQAELDIAAREHKDIYVYKLQESNPINDSLTRAGKKAHTSQGEYEGETVISRIGSRVFLLDGKQLGEQMVRDSQEIKTILKGMTFEDKETLMEQYKMFVQTSEDLVTRKQSVNTFYITLNSIMLSAIVSIVCAAGDLLQFESGNLLIYIVSAFLSAIGVVICTSWITLLRSYADLNASKMAIIGCIEEHLALKLYDTEWALLTRRIGSRKYRSFTVKEVAVAKIFMVLYVCVIAVCMILIFIK